MTTTISRPRSRQRQVSRLRQGSRVLRPHSGRHQHPIRAEIPRMMGPANRAPGTPIMGAPDPAGGVGVVGGPDAGPRVYAMGAPDAGPRVHVMGAPDAGPRAAVMGASDPRFVDWRFTGGTR
jgi:hypothetical protein